MNTAGDSKTTPLELLDTHTHTHTHTQTYTKGGGGPCSFVWDARGGLKPRSSIGSKTYVQTARTGLIRVRLRRLSLLWSNFPIEFITGSLRCTGSIFSSGAVRGGGGAALGSTRVELNNSKLFDPGLKRFRGRSLHVSLCAWVHVGTFQPAQHLRHVLPWFLRTSMPHTAPATTKTKFLQGANPLFTKWFPRCKQQSRIHKIEFAHNRKDPLANKNNHLF